LNPVAAPPLAGATTDGRSVRGAGPLNKSETYSVTFSKAGHLYLIPEGEAVTLTWKTQETPYTLTFLGGSPALEVAMPQPQAGGPPKLQLNPAVVAPAGDAANWNGAVI
jgi:hypothetical protein